MANEKEIFGLPQILIEFKTRGVTAIKRSARGIVALILKQGNDAKSYTIKSIDKIPNDAFNANNLDYVKQVLLGTPLRVLVEVVPEAAPNINTALLRLKGLKWNYICYPGADAKETTDLVSWVKAQRTIERKTYKAVVAHNSADHEGVINFTTEEIKVGEKTYSATEYTPRIAGILAGLALDRSATYFKLTEVESIKTHETPDEDINKGQLVLINDGDYVKIGRAANSLVTFTTDKGEDFRKIKIVEAVDMITDDIRDTFNEYYVGKIINDYDHKMLFIAAINVYLSELEGNVLDRKWDNAADINEVEQRNYAKLKGEDVDAMDVMAIRTYNTGSKVFLEGSIKPVDAMEDLSMTFYM